MRNGGRFRPYTPPFPTVGMNVLGVSPSLLYMFDFYHNTWHVIYRKPINCVHAQQIEKVFNLFKKDDLFNTIADNVLNNIIDKIQH